MYIASFNLKFKWSREGSIISKQFSVLSALQVYKETRIMHGNQEKEKRFTFT